MALSTIRQVTEVRFRIALENYDYIASAFGYDYEPIGERFVAIDNEETQYIDGYHLLFDVVIGKPGEQLLGPDYGVADIINAFKTTDVLFYPVKKSFTGSLGDTFNFTNYEVNLDLGRNTILSAEEIGILEYGTLLKMKTKSPVSALPNWMNF